LKSVLVLLRGLKCLTETKFEASFFEGGYTTEVSRWELSSWAQGGPKEMASECGQWLQDPRKKRLGIFYPAVEKKEEAKHQTKLH
jgi:hypothetical protein